MRYLNTNVCRHLKLLLKNNILNRYIDSSVIKSTTTKLEKKLLDKKLYISLIVNH